MISGCLKLKLELISFIRVINFRSLEKMNLCFIPGHLFFIIWETGSMVVKSLALYIVKERLYNY